MEENQPASLFEVDIDNNTQQNLLSISKWTKFIAVVVLIFVGLCILSLAFAATRFEEIMAQLSSYGGDRTNAAGILLAVGAIALILIIIWMVFLLKASNLIRRGLKTREPEFLAQGFRAMRTFFVFNIIFSVLGILSALTTILM